MLVEQLRERREIHELRLSPNYLGPDIDYARAVRSALLVVVVSFLSSSCAPILATLAQGAMRGRADLVVKRDEGTGIVYLERKPHKKPAGVVVMLHGLGGNKDHWPFLCAELPEELWLIAPDMPGSGDSPQAASYELDLQVARLHQFLANLGVKKPQIVGNSLGGMTAAVYGLKYPDDVASLALLDPAGIDKNEQHAPLIKTAADFDQLIKDSFAHPPEIPGVLRDYFGEQAAAGAPIVQKVLDDALKMDLKPKIPTLQPPTLVVWGEKDKLVSLKAAQEWRDEVPGHLVVVMADTGHAPMVERPGETAQLLLTWWTREKVFRP
jgi:pimeloyl-ACP methyl ester carboxylesterase